MLPKKNRADTGTVERIFKTGRFINSTNLSFKFLLNNSSTGPQIAFVAPKNIAKSAVVRNSLRRRGYSALGKHLHKFPANLSGVFVFKKGVDSLQEIENEIEKILHKIN